MEDIEQLSLFEMPEERPTARQDHHRQAKPAPIEAEEYHDLLGLIYYNGERDLVCLTVRSKGKYPSEEVWSEGYVYPAPFAQDCPVCHPAQSLPTYYAAWKRIDLNGIGRA